MLTSKEIRRAMRENLRPREAEIANLMREVANLNAEDWSDAKLLAHTQRGLDRAIAQGLQTQEDLIGFLTYRHIFGERFDEFPAVRQFLARKDLPAGGRMQLMMLELPIAIWDVVKRRTPPGPSGEFEEDGS